MPNTNDIALSIPWLKTRRTLLAFMVLITSVAGLIAMNHVVMSLTMGWQVTMLVLFALTFTWIALAFWGALCGFAVCALRRDPLSLRKLDMEAPSARLLVSRTALVMPIYAEPPIPTFAGLEATCHSLLSYAIQDEQGEAARPMREHFEVFILSDTQDAAVAEIEETHVAALQHRFADKLAIHYRRRPNNHGRKAGNIAEFCNRWGCHYDYMIVLDADSLMSGATLLRMVQRMQRQPSIGLIQTVPIPVGQKTLFGRFIQFSSALYSPMLAAGQSFWQGDAANYWGHNAIIRIHAFMDHAGLPTLPGKPPLGGEILSHDFVEAALLKRGGWQVILDTTITTAVSRHDPYASASHNSFEAMPSNLLDFAKRDRRWLQGNLQHLRLLGGAGLHPLSRMHFFYGAFAYLSSLVWLGLLLCTSVLVTYHVLSDAPGQLLPQRLNLDPFSLGLLSITLVMLFAPKLLGLILALWQTPHAFGGRLRLLISAVFEMLFAALLAPLMMAWHSLFIINVLIGSSIDWQTQPRGERSLTWRETWQHTGWLTLTGLAWAGTMVFFSPIAFGWLTPAWLGLIVAVPIVKYSSSGTWGSVISHKWGLLKTPSNCLKPPLLNDFLTLMATSDAHPLDPSTRAPFPLQCPPTERFGEMPCQSFQQFDRHALVAPSSTTPPSTFKEPN